MTEAQYDNQADENAEREDLRDHLVLILSNGLRVANFSSPHEFKFTDGCVLPAVSNELSTALSLKVDEKTYSYHTINGTDKGFKTIKVEFMLDERVREEMDYWQEQYKLGFVDVVLVPRPCIDAFRAYRLDDTMLNNSPFRTIRVADRLCKTIHIDKFCI